MKKKIGMLIPEFPGQTHNFFWREIEALRELGADILLFSTRCPPIGVQSTSWGDEAMRETTYLFPISARSLFHLAVDLIRAPTRSLRCAKLFLRSLADLTPGESSLRLFGLMLLGVSLGRMCKDRQLSHIHVHSCADAANIALFASAAFGVCYSLTLHNPLSEWGGNQFNKWRHATFGIAIADWILNDARATLGAALPAKMFIAPMGVNVDAFQRKSPYQPAMCPSLRLFSCARLNPAKGFEILLESIRLLKSGAPNRNILLTIAGEDDMGGNGYRLELEKKISELGLRDSVRLLGAVSEGRVRDELEAAHVFVLASLEEPLGVAIMEAMAMEVPVIATNAGGVPCLITDGVDGVLVPPANASALAEAILRLADDPQLAMHLSARARLRIIDSFHHRRSARVIFDNVQATA